MILNDTVTEQSEPEHEDDVDEAIDEEIQLQIPERTPEALEIQSDDSVDDDTLNRRSSVLRSASRSREIQEPPIPKRIVLSFFIVFFLI